MGKKQGLLWKRYQKSLLMIVLGILLMVGGKMITPKTEDTPVETLPDTHTDTAIANVSTETEKQLEQEIETLLCSISGVKEATVVITYADSGQQQIEKDVSTQTDETKEEDGQGGNRTVASEQKQENTVYVEDAEGNRYPFIKTETYGTIRGVAVVVNGTYDESIREKIVRTLEVLLDVPTHKIQVIW